VFTRGHHQSLSWARWMQSTPLNPIYLRSIYYYPLVYTYVFQVLPIPSQMNTIHTLKPYLSKIHFIIILQSMPRSSKWSLPFRLLNQNFVHISHLASYEWVLRAVLLEVKATEAWIGLPLTSVESRSLQSVALYLHIPWMPSWCDRHLNTGQLNCFPVSARQVEHIRIKHHIHMLSYGRANMCGLSSKNIDQVAEAIHDTVTKVHN
jgi:hypothetical protein